MSRCGARGHRRACVALLLGAAPAFAHTRLESSDPGDKSSVDAAPASVSLTFNEAISAEFATLSVVGPDGTNYQSGPVSAANGQVSTAVSPLGPAGVYEIGYRVVSDDGHPVSGKVSFTLTTAGPGSPDAQVPAATAAPNAVPNAAPPDAGGAPVWPWIVGAVVLVVAGVILALRLGRVS